MLMRVIYIIRTSTARYLRCSEKSCKAKAIMTGEHVEVTKAHGEHKKHTKLVIEFEAHAAMKLCVKQGGGVKRACEKVFAEDLQGAVESLAFDTEEAYHSLEDGPQSVYHQQTNCSYFVRTAKRTRSLYLVPKTS